MAYPPIPDAGTSQDGVAASEVVSPVALAKAVGQRNRLGHVKDSLPCGCEGVCLCPGGFANQAHAPGCQCDQCSH